MVTFGDKLRELMKSNNKMTQQQLADILNVERGSVSNWVTNRRFPDRNILLKLSEVFDVTVDYLIGASSNSDDLVTDEEANELYEMFEQLDEEGKEIISMMINKLIDNKK